MKWRGVGETAGARAEPHAGVAPLSVRFTDLHRWVTELPGFADDPQASSEKLLEAIQMTWLDEVED
jgi:FeS assembly protein IscX